jgi:hypothetical protein
MVLKDDLKDITVKFIVSYSNKDSKRIDKYVERKAYELQKLNLSFYQVDSYAFYCCEREYLTDTESKITVNCLVDFKNCKIEEVGEVDAKVIRKVESGFHKLNIHKNEYDYFEPNLVAFLNHFYKETVGLKEEVKETILKRFCDFTASQFA